MRLGMADAIGGGQVFQLERGRAIDVGRPVDPVRSQGMGQTQGVDQIPARIAVAPLAGIGVVQIAIQQVAGDFVVEADAVVADPTGAGLTQNTEDAGRELGLDHTLALGELRRDAGEETGVGMGQQIGRGTAVEHQRRADFIQIGIGAQTGELTGTITMGIGAPGFVIVPVEGLRQAVARPRPHAVIP